MVVASHLVMEQALVTFYNQTYTIALDRKRERESERVIDLDANVYEKMKIFIL